MFVRVLIHVGRVVFKRISQLPLYLFTGDHDKSMCVVYTKCLFKYRQLEDNTICGNNSNKTELIPTFRKPDNITSKKANCMYCVYFRKTSLWIQNQVRWMKPTFLNIGVWCYDYFKLIKLWSNCLSYPWWHVWSNSIWTSCTCKQVNRPDYSVTGNTGNTAIWVCYALWLNIKYNKQICDNVLKCSISCFLDI